MLNQYDRAAKYKLQNIYKNRKNIIEESFK